MSNKLITSSVAILATNLLTFLTTMINTRILATIFSLEEYGYRSQILSIVAILTAIFSLGISNSPIYFISQENETKRKNEIIINLYILIFIIVSISLAITYLSYNFFVIYYKNPKLYSYKIIVSLMLISQIIYPLYTGIMVSLGKTLHSTKIGFIRSVIIVSSTFLLYLLKKEFQIFMLVTSLIEVLIVIYTICDCIDYKVNLKSVIDFVLIKKILSYSIPLSITSITIGLCTQIDKLFVTRYFSTEEFAIYTNMSTELPVAAISGAFITVISPYVVKLLNKNKVVEAIRLWKSITEFVAIFLFYITSVLFVYGELIITILYSEKYLIGIILFRIFIFIQITRVTYFGLILRSYGKSKWILFCAIITLILNIFLNFVFICFYKKITSFAMATVVSAFIMQFLQLIISCKILNFNFKEIFPWKKIFFLLVTNIIFSIIFYNITYNFFKISNFFCIVILIFIWGLSYLFCVYKKLINLWVKIQNLEAEIDILEL